MTPPLITTAQTGSTCQQHTRYLLVILSRTKSATESRELQFVMGCFTCLHVIKTFMSVSRSHDWVPPDDPRGFMEGLLSVSITLRTVQLLMDER